MADILINIFDNMKNITHKIALVAGFLILGYIQVFPQDLPQIISDKTIGGNFADRIGQIYPAPDGGWYLFGTSSSSAGFEKSAAPYTLFGNDIWMMKYNSNWEKQWDKVFGGTDEESLSGVLKTNDGGFLIGASSSSGISGDKSESSRSPGENDYWLIKVDADGVKQWDKTYGGGDIDNLSSIRHHPQGGYILSGTSYSGASGEKTHASFGKQDYWVIRIDENGNFLWDKVFGGERFDQNPGLYPLWDGFIITGKSDSPPSGNKTATERGSYDAWLVKIDFDGNKIWDKAFGGDDNEGGAGITKAVGGGFMLSITSKSSISGDKTTPDFGANDAWFVKVDSNFNYEWDKTIGTVNQDQLSALRAGGGGYILKGTHTIEDAQPGGGIIEYGDRWMVHTDDNLNILWEYKFGGDKNETGGGEWRLESDTTILLMGSSSNSDISRDKSENSRGGMDFWLTMIQMPFGLYTHTGPVIKTGNVSIYPNPVAGDEVFFVSDNRKIREIMIYSVTGALMKSCQNLSEKRARVVVSDLSPGIFIGRIITSDGNSFNKKFIKR